MFAQLRRLPILLILVAGVSALFMVFNYDHEKQALKDRYGLLYHEKILNLETFIGMGRVYGRNHLLTELNDTLENARLNRKIDFYILQYEGSVLFFGEKNNQLERIDVKYAKNTEPMSTPSFSYRSVDIGDGYQLTIGFETDFAAFFAENKFRFSDSLTYTEGYALFIILFVGLWTLRDIMQIVREMKRGKNAKLSGIKSQSTEANVFMKGLTGYNRAVADLEAEANKLGRQVLPSLQKELHSGRQPPYDFECTMVRTDINNFSVIFNRYNVTEFMATINEFFDEVSRIVARYGGLVHEFVGDEVIFYFKDDEHQNSFAIALSTVRDIHQLAERFHNRTTTARGYPFTVKSSLAHGKVRFGPLVGGFTIAGSVLIETVRILSTVTEKDENVALFDGIHEERIKSLIQSEERMRVKLKGYEFEISLREYRRHSPLPFVLETLAPETVNQLGCYRGDDDLQTIISDLRAKMRERPVAVTLQAIRVLGRPHIAKAQIKLGAQLGDWIDDLERGINVARGVDRGSDSVTDVRKILSAVVKLYINLVPRADFAAADHDRLKRLLQSHDRRVVANTVEVLTHFSIDLKQVSNTALKSVMKSLQEDLRSFANIIVLEGRDELTPNVIKNLRDLLSSRKAPALASGLFALGELAAMHRSRDLIYFAAHLSFQSLIAELDPLAQHPNPMVRKQALTAARKTQDEELIAKIRQAAIDSGSDLLIEEADRFLNPPAPRTASSAA